jgi:ABC-2 type transport system ATP-binding protein
MGRLYHLSKEDSEKRAQELLERFSLVDAAERTAKTYSGGMRRRLDLAASLVATPPIIFLDEPTTGLDPRSRIQMWDVIEDLRRGGATILLTTQYLEEADKLADRIAVIDRGTVIAEGTADELKAKVGKERLEIIVKENALDAAAQAMGQGARVEREDGAVSIETANVGEVRRALESLEAAGVAVESLSLHKPTLDDVFLKLTGHEAEGKTTETV